MTDSRPCSPPLSETFSLVDPPSPFPPHLVFSDPFEANASCGGLSKGKGIRRLWDALASPKRRLSKDRTEGDDGSGDDMATGARDIPELIDDEACYFVLPRPHQHPHHPFTLAPINRRKPRKLDIIALLPPEIALYSLSFLSLPDVLRARLVSKTWRSIADDISVWKGLFSGQEKDHGWRVKPAYLSYLRDSLHWKDMYQTRHVLERRFLSRSIQFEPVQKILSGHEDSVYCLEYLPHVEYLPLNTPSVSPYTSKPETKWIPNVLISGSRDKSIRIWDLSTCLLGHGPYAPDGISDPPLITLRGHRGSVLCLKYDESGFMVSGSSDCCVIVWDLGWGPCLPSTLPDEEPRMMNVGSGKYLWRRPRAIGILGGHTGGVLDLGMNDKWIVSCSKDGTVCVYHRHSLKHHIRLIGHEGPVNAIGLQGDRVVSASGDGKMFLWNISATEGNEVVQSENRKLRTFIGHERGLACVEFKDDYIISGSNDCTIKVWSAETGTCLRTLVGHTNLVRALAFDPAIGVLVSASYDRSVRVWDLRETNGEGSDVTALKVYNGPHRNHIFDVKFDCGRIFSSGHDQRIVVFDFTEGLDAMMFY